jgi:single-stranded-DNA-specific exonuclease
MRTAPKVGIASLAAVAGSSVDSLDADSVAFALAPRLNAAGRMADPAVSLGLLMSDEPADAEALAQTLDEYNRVRQSVEHDLVEAALARAEREFEPGDRALVLAGEGWHEGVKGIVASRLAKRFRVPVILFAIEDGEARGSGRSVGFVDLFSAVSECQEVTVRFGGHAAAVGVTVATQDIDRFKELLLAALSSLPEEQFDVATEVDALIDLEDVSVELAMELDRLAPFGHSNRKPLFGSIAVFMNGRERVGRTANHLKFTAYDGVTSVPAISFRCQDIEARAAHDAAVDLAYEVSADEWRGRVRVQLIVRDLLLRPEGERGPAAELVEDLFEHADAIIAREEYVGIEDAESFHTKLAGVTFEGRQELLESLEPGTPLRLERQADNPHDANACALHDPSGAHIGYLNRRLAAVLAPVIDAGVEYDVEVTEVTGGEEGRSKGVNVLVSRRAERVAEEDSDSAVDRRAALESLNTEQLRAELTSAFIGEGALHDAQQSALAGLERGESTLAVMATGRGKSLIFQLHACALAVQEGKASVFAYPLRALVADQAYHLEETLAPLGIGVAVLTGESSPMQRDEVFDAIASGETDLVLTTPEFLVHHAERFARAERVGFVVIDEAHHVAEAGSGHRPAYGRLGEALEVLGAPEVLAVTATADDDIAKKITTTLGITNVVTDPTTRENLVLQDSRGGGDKDAYIAGLAAKGNKGIVYVNSREQSVRLARMLRKKVPELAYKVAFYNGGLTRSARHAVERAFRAGDVTFIVATSAFGEGVNIPDVRDVVLYHLPFNGVEFNQMSGRAGRDGAIARVHPIFGEKDGRVNEMILSSAAPERDDMAGLYLVLRDASTGEDGWIEATNAELAEAAKKRDAGCSLNDRGVSSAIGVFRELGLVESEGYGAYRRLRVLPRPEEKTDLTASVRYSEGKREIEDFEAFRAWVLEASADDLLHRFNRPILPTRA